MLRFLFVIALALALAAAACLPAGRANAEILIFGDSKSGVNLYNNGNKYYANDLQSSFVLEKSFAPDAIFSKNNSEIWGSYVSKETVTLLYSQDNGVNFTAIPTLLNLQKGRLNDLIAQKTFLHILFERNKNHYYVRSNDRGLTFTPAIKLASQVIKDPVFKTAGDSVFYAVPAKDNRSVIFLGSEDSGNTFTKTDILLEGFNILYDLALYTDWQNKPHLFVLTYDNNKYQINHVRKADNKWLSDPIYQSNTKIDALKIQYLNETNSLALCFLQNSAYLWAIFNGEALTNPKEIKNDAQEILGWFYHGEKLYWVSGIKPNEISGASLPEVSLLLPKDQSRINSNKLTVKFDGRGTALYKIDLSADPGFNDENILSFYSTSPEAQINTPFSSGAFYLRAAASDGITFGKTSPSAKIIIDTVKPKILNIDYPKTINQDTFKVIIVFSEPVTIESNQVFALKNPGAIQNLETVSLTCEAASLEAILKIKRLEEGLFDILISGITDPAGNRIELNGNLPLTINRQMPMIKINQPQNNSWYKPDTLIIIDAEIEDLQNDLPENPAVKTLLDNQASSVQASYNKDNHKLFGFLTIPKELNSGKHLLDLEITDLNGNIGKNQLSFNIDSIPPKPLPPTSPTSERKAVKVPYIENGSGIDPASSIIQIREGSREVSATFEVTANNLVVFPPAALTEGNHAIRVNLRDRAGNSATSEVFNLTIKEGVASEQKLKAAQAADFRYGPNPFNPQTQVLKVKYLLGSPMEINFFVFTMTGRNIMRINSPSASSHLISWNGKDQFGEQVQNGVYLFAILGPDLSSSILKRGKIIVLR